MVQKSTYDLADWKRVQHEDEGSISQDPQFKNAGGDKPDDYSLPNGSPGVGFVVFPLTAGRTGHAPEPPSVEPTFPTKTFLPSDF